MSNKSNVPAAKPEKAETSDQPTKKTEEKPATTEGEKPETPKDPAAGYARGEGQKPVSPRYRSNWDNIFGKKR